MTDDEQEKSDSDRREQGVRQFIVDLQAHWSRGNIEALTDFYHEDVVLLPPDLGAPISGRGAVVSSYREFIELATLHAFNITDLAIFSFNTPRARSHATHMAHMRFEIIYSLDDQAYRDEGLEIYAINQDDEGLQIIWRSQNVLDSRTLEKSDPVLDR